MSDYVIAVRTYRRAHLFSQSTLRVLQQHGLVERLHVFVGSDVEEYRAVCGPLNYIPVPPGADKAIRAICAFFPHGQPIVFMDDDLSDFCMYDQTTDTFLRHGLSEILVEGFRHAPFSFGFLKNRLWLRRQPRLRLSYGPMPGCFFGAYNQPELITTSHAHAEDTLRTVQYLKAGLVPTIFPGGSFQTRYGITAGGMTDSGDRADTRRVCEEIEPQVRGWCSYMEVQKCGLWAWKWKSPQTLRRTMENLTPL